MRERVDPLRYPAFEIHDFGNDAAPPDRLAGERGGGPGVLDSGDAVTPRTQRHQVAARAAADNQDAIAGGMEAVRGILR
jgi:hypothetical protein